MLTPSLTVGLLPRFAAVVSFRFTARGLAASTNLTKKNFDKASLAEAWKLMRWKLLILTSLVTAIAGVGLALVVILGFYGSMKRLSTHELSLTLTFTIPLA
ncbi:MAG: hypothetical protein ABR607_17565, partial [Pyrinomonadaceae bacterium]